MVYYSIYIDGVEQPGKYERFEARMHAFQAWDKASVGVVVSVCGWDDAPDTLTGFWKDGEYGELGWKDWG